MPEKKERMSIWVEEQDRAAMRAIRDAHGLPTDSAALRYAVRRVAKEIEADQARARRGGR